MSETLTEPLSTGSTPARRSASGWKPRWRPAAGGIINVRLNGGMPTRAWGAIGKYDQIRQIKVLKATNPYAKDIHTHVLQVVCGDLDKAFQAFFRRVKVGEKEGYPPCSFIPLEGLCRISPK